MAVLAPAGRVGAVAIAALIILGSMWVFFSKNSVGAKYYYVNVLFADASGAAKGVNVELAGKPIGAVDSFELDKKTYKAVLHLKIDARYPIPLHSTFSVITPILGSQGIVAVTPPPPAKITGERIASGSVIEGTPTEDINAALGQTGSLIATITATTKKINKLLDRSTALLAEPNMREAIDTTLANVKQASANGTVLTNKLNRDLDANNQQLQQILRETGTSSKIVFSNLQDTTGEIKAITHDNRAKIEDIITNMQDTTSAISGLTDQLNQSLDSGGVAKNLSATVANLKLTTDKLAQMTTDLQQFTSDPQLKGDIRRTIHNVAESTEQSTYLLKRLNHLVGGHSSSDDAGTDSNKKGNGQQAQQSSSHGESLPLLMPRLDLIQDFTHRHFRADVDSIIPFSNSLNQFGEIGLYNVGDSARLNLEYGKALFSGSGVDGRIGLHRSKLGVGLDLGLGDPLSFQFDAYDPNRLSLDARGVLMLNKTTGFSAGVDNINHKPGLNIGVEIRP